MSGKKDPMTVTVTFRDNEKWIYDEICKHSCKGGYVKDILAQSLKGSKDQEVTRSVPPINNILDF